MNLTHADECEAVILALANGPLSLDEVESATKFSHGVANGTLIALRLKGRVTCETVRIKKVGKVAQYSLKLKG